MAFAPIFILNGPNLNLLGKREPDIYGLETLAEIEADVAKNAAGLGFTIDFRQTNSEGALIDWVQEAGAKSSGLIINPGGYTHSSVALLDALNACAPPKIELHLSNIYARESFRRRSMTASAVDGVILGFGAAGYRLSLEAIKSLLQDRPRGKKL